MNTVSAAAGLSRERLSLKDVLWALMALVGMLLACFPNPAVRIFIDPSRYAAIKVDDLNYHHRLIIYPAVVIPLILYFCLNESRFPESWI